MDHLDRETPMDVEHDGKRHLTQSRKLGTLPGGLRAPSPEPGRAATTWRFLAGLLAWGLLAGSGLAQTAPGAAKGAAATTKAAQGAPAAAGREARAAVNAQEPRARPSESFQESIRKTVEKRRQRRARRAGGQGLGVPRPVGAIVPWPMPPALIVRQTPQVHEEVDSLLGGLRQDR